MKIAKKLLMVSLAGFTAASLTSCNWFKKKKNNDDPSGETLYFSYSIGLASGASVVEVGQNQQIVVYDNGIDTAERSYSYESTNPAVATVDGNGFVRVIAPGRVNFIATEAKSGQQKALKKEIVVSAPASSSRGGYNYSGGTSAAELEKRAEILGKLEKYAMDSHLTGITLFDNGGYVKYSSRVNIPTLNKKYIQGYGFGILSDGSLTGELPGENGQREPTYYHSTISQDSYKINQYTATGSQVSDLAGYITSTYWGTRLNAAKDDYEWYPVLAKDRIRKPSYDGDGNLVEPTGSTAIQNNDRPVPVDAKYNPSGLYKKWRVYVKVDGENKIGDTGTETLGFTTVAPSLSALNRPVTIDDYMFSYRMLLTGSTNVIRGTQMAADTSHGFKGAQRFFNQTKNKSDADARQQWNDWVAQDKIGVKSGFDTVNNCSYLELELINPIDEFTAMYTLSSSLVSPLPEEMFYGPSALGETMKESADIYGTFGGDEINDILKTTVCCGPYTLKKWVGDTEIVFQRNDAWFEYKPGGSRYQIPGIHYRVYDTSTDTEKNWKQFGDGNLDSAGVPTSKLDTEINQPNVYATDGDATFKLNVNSCTEEEWQKLFGPEGTVHPNTPHWDIKPWMSNSDFLDGLFYSIDREAFARKRGMTPSINYFSDAYQMRNADGGKAYNKYSRPVAEGGKGINFHEEAVKGYSENFGYNYDKAVDCFRNAVKQLSNEGKIVLGSSKANPTEIHIHIRWMYNTDVKEYGEDIKYYFETAFNDDAVCGGKVKLVVDQEAVSQWEEVYNVWMMQGRFDLGFGAISGDTYNPLNFLEVLKSDNSSKFTLNWGQDTSKIDEKNPIIYDGKKWSFDALWEVADHGGIVDNGVKVNPVKSCTMEWPKTLDTHVNTNDLNNGFELDLPVDFAEFSGEGGHGAATFDASRFDVYVYGYGNITLAEKTANARGDVITYDKNTKKMHVVVSPETAAEVSEAIKVKNHWDVHHDYDWQLHPFDLTKKSGLFDFELYYSLSIDGGTESINYAEISNSGTIGG